MQVVISVEGIKVWAFHGVYAEEQVNGRYFVVDATVTAELNADQLLSDRLEATVNYETIYRIVHEKMAQPAALLEKVALDIAQTVQSADQRIVQTRIKLTKLQPPLGGEVASTSVEIIV